MDVKSLAPAAIALVVVVIILAIAGIILVDFREDQVSAESLTVTNQSLTFTNNVTTVTGLSGANVLVTTTGFTIYNQSGTEIDDGNFTLYTNGSFRITANYLDERFSGTDDANINLSFTWTRDERNAMYNATASGIEGVGNFSGQLPLLATVIIFAVIIAVVVGFLGGGFGGGKGRAGSPGGTGGEI